MQITQSSGWQCAGRRERGEEGDPQEGGDGGWYNMRGRSIESLRGEKRVGGGGGGGGGVGG